MQTAAQAVEIVVRRLGRDGPADLLQRLVPATHPAIDERQRVADRRIVGVEAQGLERGRPGAVRPGAVAGRQVLPPVGVGEAGMRRGKGRRAVEHLGEQADRVVERVRHVGRAEVVLRLRVVLEGAGVGGQHHAHGLAVERAPRDRQPGPLQRRLGARHDGGGRRRGLLERGRDTLGRQHIALSRHHGKGDDQAVAPALDRRVETVRGAGFLYRDGVGGLAHDRHLAHPGQHALEGVLQADGEVRRDGVGADRRQGDRKHRARATARGR